METKTHTIRMKIDTQNFMNNLIDGINKVSEMLQEPYEPEEGDEFGRDLPRGLLYTDIGLKVLAGYLNDIGKRALELKDPELIKLLQDMHVLTEKEIQDEHLCT